MGEKAWKTWEEWWSTRSDNLQILRNFFHQKFLGSGNSKISEG